MNARRRTYDALVERASEQQGFVTTSDARELEIAPVYLRRLASLGKIENRWRGVYRLPAIAITDHDEYQEAVLWAGEGGVVVGESALALWDLADVNPRRVQVSVVGGRRPRRLQPNGHVEVMALNVEPEDVDEVDNVPVVRARTAIAHGISGGTDPSLVRQAISSARARELIGEVTEARLLVALDERGPIGRAVPIA